MSGDGYGFKSIYGGEFPDENFIVKNFAAGLGMANRGEILITIVRYSTTAIMAKFGCP